MRASAPEPANSRARRIGTVATRPRPIDHRVLPSKPMTSIAWFRRDLRLEDNPAWSAACADGPVVAVFVLEPGLLAATGTPRQDLFLGAVHSLAAELRDAGGTLHILAGPATSAIPAAVAAVKPTSVHCNADPSPFARHRDAAVTEVVGERLRQHWGNSVHAPGTVLTQKGTLSQVFTPFSRSAPNRSVRYELMARPIAPRSRWPNTSRRVLPNWKYIGCSARSFRVRLLVRVPGSAFMRANSSRTSALMPASCGRNPSL